MIDVLSRRGLDDLGKVLARGPLLGFDLDGTLAPIVDRPSEARPSPEVDARMKQLCTLAPVAVITGRDRDDAAQRLGFTPRYLIGNHGIEGLASQGFGALQEIVANWVRQLKPALANLPSKITLEQKRYSLSLHYRGDPQPTTALASIEQLIAAMRPLPRRIDGKFVVNLLLPFAPDKFDAIAFLLQKEQRSCAVFIGDDLTDELVFQKAPPLWMTIRIGHSTESSAHYHLEDQAHIFSFIQEIIAFLTNREIS